MKIVPYDASHAIIPQAAQRHEVIAPGTGESFTGLVDGVPIFCAGRVYGNGAWAILSEDAGKHMLAVTRAVKKLIKLHGPTRLEALIDPKFKQGHRWAKLLGFEFEEVDEETGYSVYVHEGPVQRLTRELMKVPASQREYPEIMNTFSEGLYTRRLFIKKGTLLVGKIHTHETMNICAKGDITILTEKGTTRFRAGDVMVSAPGIQKVGYAHEDTVWVNVIPTSLRDLAAIEEEFVRDPDPVLVDRITRSLRRP